MANHPLTFRDLVEADLRRAARLAVKVQDEIDPQLRIATPEGDYALGVTLPADTSERALMLRRIATFMAWKRAFAFTLAAELVEPDSVYCVGVSATERHACLSLIARTPRPWTLASFGRTEWLPASTIDPSIASLLPIEPRALTPKDVADAERWFAVTGRFPAVHIATGEVRGLGR